MGDAELVAQAVGGDRDAFAALYDQHAPGVNDFLRRMLGNPHDAADALQDTFIAAGARLHQLRDPSKFRPWLYAIARRQAYSATSSRSRRQQREPELPEDERMIAAPEVDPTDAIADAELGRLVDDAAAGLDERDRAVLHLHFRLGLGGDELAAALGVERNNAHVLVHRVRERLQTALGALLVARHGRSACSQLDAILGGWDGTLTTVVRKRVNRHTEGCETCGATRSNGMRPAGLLGLVPLAPLPASAREAVLDRVELCSHTGEPWPGDDGFPPGDDRPVTDGRGRARRVLVSAVVALLVVLLAGSVVLADADRVDRGVPGPTTTTEEPEGTSTTRRSPTSSTATTAAPGAVLPEVTATTRRPTTPTTRRPTTTTRRPSTTPTTPTTATPGPDPTPTTAPPPPPTTTTTTDPPPTTSTTRPPPPTTTTTRRPVPPPPPPTTTTTSGPNVG